jgi:hypothetical protein
MNSHLEMLARRADADPFFLGCMLQQYARSEGFTEQQLMNVLGCSPESLTLLRLCRAPGGPSLQFQKGIEEISARFNINPGLLAEAVRRGQAILELARPIGAKGTLAAARDGEETIRDDRQSGG